MDWGAERRRTWQALSDALKDAFFGHASGKPLEKEMTASEVVQIDGIPVSFALVVLVPHYVDLVELAQMQRTIFSEENGVWSSQGVAL
ncbi:hypothetical protein MVES1_002028 [Malassezia vespertilionis]|nr:uncharacterized protein MVES1_002028 [Malassezia vespertilionis]WFD06674.1 hypothetical protein MVES1_002028 [Malassezia vespertilionis]